MVNKYKLPQGVEFLVYGPEKIPEELKCELLEENINLFERIDLHNIPIMNIYDLALTTVPYAKKRTRDKILSSEHIDSFYDLQNAYHLVKIGKSNFSSRVRRLITEKYSDIINLEYNKNENQ